MLALVTAASAVALIPDNQCQPCDVTTTCDTIPCKVPAVSKGLPPGPGLEAGMSNSTRRSFEHLVGHALRRAEPVRWATAQFAARTDAFLTAASGGNKTAALEAAFVIEGADWKKNAGYTGYVGPDLHAIQKALTDGNIRERWGLMYVLTKTHAMTDLMRPLADAAAKSNDTAGLTKLGLNAEAVMQRRKLVAGTEAACKKPDAPSGCSYIGMPDFSFDPFNSWVRFDFAVGDLWNGSRAYYPQCKMTGLRSDDPSIDPPLSAAETRLQCNGTGPCMLSWCQGQNAEYVVTAPLPGGIPGYLARARALNYRTVAGPSATTSSILQLGLLLGADGDELAALRLTMNAWMLPTNDHSLFEMLLGGDPYLTPEFHTVFNTSDLGKLMPRDLTLGGKVFKRAEVWSELAAEFATPDGRELCKSLPDGTLNALRELDARICA
eukprot:TRINITY_DN39814_c0_g1_i1.p1 TRINITY_DN39814_c0_g1~~TRINITY_DN39814_c0_g1_i1.p1  ORF type:complete len:460 (+),score=173.47 TRINITY_DN39814_c0_g1_i1:72-1382(+)